MRSVIVVNGAPRAGKNTAVDFMRDHLLKHRYSVDEMSSIDGVAWILDMAEIDVRAKTPADRKLLSDMADALETHCQWRTRRCLTAAKKWLYERGPNCVFFLHLREPDLIDVIEKGIMAEGRDFKFFKVLVRSDRAETVISNHADAGVEGTSYHAVIENNGTLENLARECRKVVRNLVLSKPVIQLMVDSGVSNQPLGQK